MEPFFISTPIYYVNANPHLGHAYTTIVADALTRFHRLMGRKTYFLTGTDEHGDKIVQAAEKTGKTPHEFVDDVSGKFKELWPQLNIQYSQFIRTTDPEHKRRVQAFMQKVYDAGDIYFGEYGGHYCLGCERFYTEKELENGVCPQHGTKPEYISEKNYFFRMAKYQGQLKQYILDNPDFIRPERYRNEVISLLDSGELEDLCISRPKTRLTWGIELPFDKDYVCYVWFDALLNYINALDWPDGDKFKEFWPGEHLVAKDILKPHAIFWPTMLMSAGVPLYRHLNVHGYWLVRDSKMSKSIGNVVGPLDVTGYFGLDSFRYFLLREMHFGSDANFTDEALLGRHNSDLANDLGNLFSRVLSMNAKYFESKVPTPGSYTTEDQAIIDLAGTAQHNFQDLFGGMRMSGALEALWELVRSLNKYVDSSAPWALYKNKDMERLGTVMHTLLTAMRKVAVHLWPVMPGTAEAMLGQLGCDFDPATARLGEEAACWSGIEPGQGTASSSNLFPRLDSPGVEAQKTDDAPKATAPRQENKHKDAVAPKEAEKMEGVALIEFADFQKVDLRVGTVRLAEPHPDADKLLRLEVEIGEDKPRQIIAGIAEFYKPADLVDLQIVVVANLAPRKLRGLESQGMLLAVHSEGGLQLVTTTGRVLNGSKAS